MKYELVYVEWVDSNNMPGWQGKEETEQFARTEKALQCCSVGILLHTTLDRIVISDSLNYSSYANNPLAIPRDAIQHMETLKEIEWN